MPVLGLLSYALEIPDLEAGVRFYTDAGLIADVDGRVAKLRCGVQERESVVLVETGGRKRLHHVRLRADGLDEIARAVPDYGGALIEAPAGFERDGLWISDPHGMLLHLVDVPEDPPIEPAPAFAINAPGRIVRKGRSAMLPAGQYGPVKPVRLGHLLAFTPDVPTSVRFVTEALGMGLADRSGDVIAFCCARKNSDHHVLAFAKSGGIGLHHGSFAVNDPDEVGRGGKALLAKAGRGHWGFGRHTAGSNFFHYVQDPWGSWFEYYCDMDFIADYADWTPTNYAAEDSLANWGPELPHDFVHNYEVEPVQAEA